MYKKFIIDLYGLHDTGIRDSMSGNRYTKTNDLVRQVEIYAWDSGDAVAKFLDIGVRSKLEYVGGVHEAE